MIDAVTLVLAQLVGVPVWVLPAAAAQLYGRVRAVVVQGGHRG